MIRRISALLYKEFIQVLRDPVALGMLLLLPIVMLLVFAYAINLDVRNIPLAVYDLDKTEVGTACHQNFRHLHASIIWREGERSTPRILRG